MLKPILLLSLASFGFAAESKERWIYLPANFQVAAETARVEGLLERAAKAGYTHALLQDSKFAHLGTVTSEYRPNVAKVKATAARLKIECVPALFPVGYSNDLLFHNPNLAEGLPVRDALFEVKNGVAEIVSDPPVSLPATESKKGWDFADENFAFEEGAAVSAPTHENARLCKRLKVSPFRQYHVSVEIKTDGLRGGSPEIKALGPRDPLLSKDADQSLNWTNLAVKPDQPWKRYDITFNSLNSTEVAVYLGIWGGHEGTVRWRDATIAECGPVNLLRREGTPLLVRKDGGGALKEGVDYEPVLNPLTGTKPWNGEFTAWHEPPQIRMKSAADGEKLRVSYFHTHVIYDGQVCACVEEPAFRELLRDQAERVTALWESKTHMMSHDEWRLLGWDPACTKSGKTPGGIAADNLRYCAGLLDKLVPGGRTFVWSDMFDPFHNAVRDYYLVNGSLEKSWEGLQPSVGVMNWNFGKRDQSLAFFAARGNPQIIAGFYDGKLADVDAWLASAKSVKGVNGFMYTTWQQDYSKLEEVAKILSQAGW